MMDDQILEISTMLYHRWTEDFETLKSVKNEVNDGSPDWHEFHKIRLENAMKKETYSLNLKNDYIGENREVINKMMGL